MDATSSTRNLPVVRQRGLLQAKMPIPAHAYSPDARYLAVAERHGMKDHIGIYDTQAGYALLRVSHRACPALMTAFPSRLQRRPNCLLVPVRKVHRGA